jgi:magnesium transporter
MVNTYVFKNVTWVDLTSPTKDEIREIMLKYNIHPLAAEELLLPSLGTKVDVYDDFIALTIHFPVRKQSHRESNQEVDFIVGKNFLITARYDNIDALYKFSKMFEVNSVLEKNHLIGEHAGYMFYYMMREMYYSMKNEMEAIQDSLIDIEKKTFDGNERAMVMEISKVSRTLLTFKQVIALHDDLLHSFSDAAKNFFGADFDHYVSAIKHEYVKISKMMHGLSESLTEVRETNNSLLETKQNTIMTTFTAITVLSAIMTIVFSWFLIDAKDTPFRESPFEFTIVGIIAILAASFAAYMMKRNKWL